MSGCITHSLGIDKMNVWLEYGDKADEARGLRIAAHESHSVSMRVLSQL